MASTPQERDDAERGDPESRPATLPEHSVLSLDEYVAMQRALGHELRFRAVRELTSEALTSTELADRLDVPSNTLHYHLDALVDAGLVQNWKRKTPDSRRLHSYYRATAMAETLLEEGIETLLQEEWELLEFYSR